MTTEGTADLEPQVVVDGEVGYRKPPAKYRFRKGQSGNPKGRPKEIKNLMSCFHEMLEEELNVNNGAKVMSKREAMLRTVINDALQGNQKAFARFMRLARRAVLFKDLDGAKFAGGVVVVKVVRSPDAAFPPAAQTND
jgi:hypothetical protein